jgi:tetratricopeptide (TPR) repeat protein
LGKGKTLYARGEKEEAQKIFSKLSKSETLFDKENKHVFNEFGIELRKKGLLEEAMSNYLKAISIDPNDEVLYYNLGRVYYEKGNYDQAVEQLRSALAQKPGFKEAQEFLTKIQSQ